MLRLGTALLATGLFLAFLPDCSSGGGGSGPGGSGGTCDSYYSALVTYYDRCQGGSATTTLTNARARFNDFCGRLLTAPGVSPTLGSELATCTNKVNGTACGEDIDCVDGKGTYADGTACGEDVQCSSGFCKMPKDAQCGSCAPRVAIGGACDASTSKICVEGASCVVNTKAGGTCKEIKKAKAGESCAGADGETTRCDANLHCDFQGGAKATCKGPSAMGESCISRTDCQNDLGCSKGKCAPLLAAGAACMPGDDCVKGYDCASDGTCKPYTTVKAGEECDNVRRCERGNCKGLTYSSSSTGTSTIKPGKCQDPIPDGAPCTTTSASSPSEEDPPECDVFAKCLGGKCTVPDPSACK